MQGVVSMSAIIANGNVTNATAEDRKVWRNLSIVVGVLCVVALLLIVVVKAVT
jgi:uncharacterized membrane protein